MRQSDKRSATAPSAPDKRNAKFATAMAVSGLTNAELARIVEVHPVTVSHWRSGKHEVPGAVLAYIALYVGVKGLLEH